MVVVCPGGEWCYPGGLCVETDACKLLTEFAPGQSTPKSTADIQAARIRRQTHMDGTVALLRMRGEKQFATHIGCQIFRTIAQGMHWKALFESDDPDLDVRYLEGQMHLTGLDSEAAQTLRHYFNMVTTLRSRVRALMQSGHLESTNENVSAHINALLQVADQLSLQGDQWRSRSQLWQPQPPFLSDNERLKHADIMVFMKHHFVNYDAFLYWNRFIVATALLHQGIVLLLNTAQNSLTVSPVDGVHASETSPESIEERISHHLSIFRRRLSDFIGIIGYAFGDLDQDGRLRGFFTRTDETKGTQYTNGYEINVAAVWQIYPPVLYFLCPLCDSLLEDWQRNALSKALLRMRKEFWIPMNPVS